MADSPDEEDFTTFIAELERVCPEAVTGLAVAGPPLPILSLRHRVEILRSLPDDAGVDALIAAWRSFASDNPAAVIRPRDT